MHMVLHTLAETVLETLKRIYHRARPKNSFRDECTMPKGKLTWERGKADISSVKPVCNSKNLVTRPRSPRQLVYSSEFSSEAEQRQ